MKNINKEKIKFVLFIQGTMSIGLSFAALLIISLLIDNIVGYLIGGAAGCFIQSKYYKEYMVIKKRHKLKWTELIIILSWIMGCIILFYLVRLRLQFLNSLPYVYVNRRVEVVRLWVWWLEAMFVSLLGRGIGSYLGMKEIEEFRY